MESFYLLNKMMKITKYDLALSVISGVLFPVAFVIPYAGIISWFLLIPFFWAIANKSPWNAFRLGILTGTIANEIGTYWLIGTLSRFGGFPHIVSFIFHLAISVYSGFLFAIFAYVTTKLGLFRKQGLISALLIASVWTSLEFLFPFLFPYGITNSQADYLPLIQIFDLFGMYSLSFLIVFVNVTLMRVLKKLLEHNITPTLEILTSLILIILIISYGLWKIDLETKKIAEAPKIRVGIVQANFDIFEKKQKNESTITERHKLMSYVLNSPELIIWPETAIQAWIPASQDFLTNEGELAIPQTKNSYFLVGGLSYKFNNNEINPEFDQKIDKFNTAFLTDPQGRILGRYNKIKLLLFGEYLPFTKYIPALKKISPASGDFTPGSNLEILEIKEKGIKIAPLICYEDIIPSFSRKFVENGANLLVNITNDAWFGKSFEPYQHLSFSIPRAVETRRFLARATNTGISAIIDSVGRVTARTGIFEQTTLEGTIAIVDGKKTLYTRIGDVFPWGCLIFWIGFVLITKFRRRFSH
ncbi:MAG TPA: apolipoprotein N-acyltransferase [Thermodesulfobacteriota bacterium]|nr:apolipoprotein N-acyltransferase [Thermodesulfobacteriota bacterium]